jgi:hypothetical protein
VHAEQTYREAMGALRDIDLEQVLREGLQWLPWRRPALALLGASNVAISEHLLPELFDLARVSHSLLSEVQRCIRRIPHDTLAHDLPSLVEEMTANPDSDHETYRRIAELLRLLEMDSLLGELTAAASMSPDPEIQEIANDFRT